MSEDDLFSGTAAALVRSGIHAVAAMQFAISDGAAVSFARGFYTALARGRRVDEAVRSGRIGILGMGRIGMAIARRLEAFGLPISYCTRRRRTGDP